ncbi:hypothetical protein I6I87_07490 [Moraxella osloensis]|nr:hypothetical protein [Moraxella osloensis]QQU05949.1 hypothetical protein I6I87_07490 [Moraxella osloensis]
MLKKSSLIFDIIGCMLGWSIVAFLWLLATINPVFAEYKQLLPVSTITNAMLIATVIGAIGGYLAFGEDKKFPPSATSVGHVLLGLGAGLFFTRGSLELMGRNNSSEDVVLFVSFLWAVGGYFILRLLIAVANSDRIKAILPDWLAKFMGVDK